MTLPISILYSKMLQRKKLCFNDHFLTFNMNHSVYVQISKKAKTAYSQLLVTVVQEQDKFVVRA